MQESADLLNDLSGPLDGALCAQTSLWMEGSTWSGRLPKQGVGERLAMAFGALRGPGSEVYDQLFGVSKRVGPSYNINIKILSIELISIHQQGPD